jgi:hypothetical protein
METHVRVLAVVYIVFSALGTIAALMVATGASGRDAAIALPVIGLTGTALFAFLLIVSLPGLVAGIGLLSYRPWARTLTLVLSALNVINVPLGTLVGVYGLYVLLSEEGARLFKPLPAATA